MSAPPVYTYPELADCAACGARRFRAAARLRFPAFPDAFQLLECASCGLLFNSPRLADQSALYRSDYYVFAESEAGRQGAAMSQFRALVDRLGADRLRGKRVLEIGAALGHLSSLLARAGARVRGVELCGHVAQAARERFQADVFAGSLAAFREKEREARFDIVVACEVLEHVPAQPAFLRDCRAVLAPGGVLVGTTPNAAARSRGAWGDDWEGFNPFHIYLYTPSALRAALGRAGFPSPEIESSAAEPAPGGVGLRRARRRLVRALDSAGIAPVLRNVVRRFRRAAREPRPFEQRPLDEILREAAPSFKDADAGGEKLRFVARAE